MISTVFAILTGQHHIPALQTLYIHSSVFIRADIRHKGEGCDAIAVVKGLHDIVSETIRMKSACHALTD